MDNQRVLIAVVLSLLVLVLWNWLFPPTPPPSRVEVKSEQVETVPTSPDQASETIAPELPEVETMPSQGRQIRVETPEYLAVFNSAGGILERFELKKYTETIGPDAKRIDMIGSSAGAKAPLGIILNQIPTWRQGNWEVDREGFALEENGEGKLVFRGRVDGVEIVRVLTFRSGTYEIKEDLTISNTGDEIQNANVSFSLASSALTEQEDRYDKTQVAYFTQNGLDQIGDLDDLAIGEVSDAPVQWAGIESNYFILAVAPQRPMLMRAKYEDGVFRATVNESLSLASGTSSSLSGTYYLGPKDSTYLSQAPNSLAAAIHYGWFDFIAKPLILVLNFFYDYVGNYGIAIIFVTIIIKILFWPLSHKSYKSMEQMKKLQPMMAKIREKHKDDRQKMNQEMMQLYKTYKVNPAGGCLPMLLQIPVFFALYQGLMGAIELRHAPFIYNLPFTDLVWIADLSAKDPFYITPIIMGGTMFLQQKMTPAPGDPTQAKIMLFLPLVFTFLFLNFPAGLVIYWLVNNVLSIFQQWLMIRKA
ncbi:MAG: membrane protein insertase YidC [Desulfovibrionales bacterium]